MPYKSSFVMRYGTVVVPAADIKTVFPSRKIDILEFTRLAKPLLGSVVLTIKHSLKTKSIIAKCGCDKRYRLDYVLPETDLDVTVTVMREEGPPCDCASKSPKLAQIRGSRRKALGEVLMVQPTKEICAAVFDKKKDKGDIEGVIQAATAWKVAQEARSSQDHDKHDDLADIQKHFLKQTIDHMAEVSVYKNKSDEQCFRMIMTSQELIAVLEKYLKDITRHPFKRVLLDATGKITRKVFEKQLLHHVLLVAYPKKDSDECYLVPVAEMVTDDSTGRNISYFLKFIQYRVSASVFKLLKQVGTDDSWANIHGILSLCDTNITQYLQLAFTVFKKDSTKVPPKLLELVSPAFCFSHLSKNWKKDMDVYTEVEIRRQMRGWWQSLTTIGDAKQLDTAIKAILVLLATPRKGDEYSKAERVLTNIWANQVLDEAMGEASAEAEIDEPLGKVIYKDSPFYKRYKGFVSAQKFKRSHSSEPNPYFSKELLAKFLKHYLAVLPFFTIIISRFQNESAERSNNGRIECSFRHLKDALDADKLRLTELGNIKLGR